MSALILCAALSACSVLERAPSVETSGFLSDYSMLKPGKADEALLLYTRPQLDLSRYHAILLEPIEVWRSAANDSDLNAGDFARLAGVLQTMVSTALAESWTMTDTPGKGVLRLRLALTDAQASSTAMDFVTTVIPIGVVARLSSDVRAFVGGASGEAEVTDSLSGELLLAAVDRRVGGKSLTGITDDQSDIMATLEHWTKRIRLRIARR